MIAGRRGLVVLDALASSAAEPGTVVRLDDTDIERHRRMAFSVHQIDLVDALLAAELSGCAPRYVAIVGLVPASIETGYGLTPRAEAGLDEMVRRALEILAEWGVRERVRA
jgi:hydrogenase maturation protease